MVYKHVIGLKTDVSQSNLGGNTDSNHLIPFFFSPASDAGFSLFCAPPCISAPVSILPWRIALTWQFEREEPRGAMLRPRLLSGLFVCLFPGIGCRFFFVLCPSLYLGPCFYSAGCYPAFSYVYSPALNAGVLRFVRGSLAPRCFFVLFPAVFRGFLSSFPRHRMPAFLCSVPLPVSRPLFLFCRMLSGLFVCLFPGIGCRCSSPSMER